MNSVKAEDYKDMVAHRPRKTGGEELGFEPALRPRAWTMAGRVSGSHVSPGPASSPHPILQHLHPQMCCNSSP